MRLLIPATWLVPFGVQSFYGSDSATKSQTEIDASDTAYISYIVIQAQGS